MINALQHIGQGVWDTDKTYRFYKRFFDFKIKLSDLTTSDQDMAPIIGSVESLRALMAMNAKGGGILELIEYKSCPIMPYPNDGGYGNYGILEVGYGVSNIDSVVADLSSQGVEFLTPVYDIRLSENRIWRCAYLQDPDGLRLQLVEERGSDPSDSQRPEIRGILHVGIGVSDLARSMTFYESVLNFDKLVYEFEGHIPEMDLLTNGPISLKLAILERSQPAKWPVDFLPKGAIKLFEVPGYPGKHIYDGRRWGDIGCMEFCLDVTDIETITEDIRTKGVDTFLDPTEIDMGSGTKGIFAYFRDPDGTIIELVEVKTVGWVSTSVFRRIAVPFLKLYDRFT
jgi:catechol 2,3-dioxygenase-like lactoylglutathione lyase family enzyme